MFGEVDADNARDDAASYLVLFRQRVVSGGICCGVGRMLMMLAAGGWVDQPGEADADDARCG